VAEFTERSLERLKAAANMADEAKQGGTDPAPHMVINSTPIMTCKITSGPVPDPGGLYTGRIVTRTDATTYEEGEQDVHFRPATLDGILSLDPDIYYPCRPSHEETVGGVAKDVYLVFDGNCDHVVNVLEVVIPPITMACVNDAPVVAYSTKWIKGHFTIHTTDPS
jgi:hypothetical protein